jgi:hypothetical protein
MRLRSCVPSRGSVVNRIVLLAFALLDLGLSGYQHRHGLRQPWLASYVQSELSVW